MCGTLVAWTRYKRGWSLYSQFVPPFPDGERKRPRFFTPREVARLQGFPESFVLGGEVDEGRLYHQLGNAVSPPIVAAVGASLLAWLEGGRSDAECAAAGVAAALKFVAA